ncbi:MAG: hypothetical protein ACRC8Z_12550 [Empedobacter falsenii]
MFGLFKSKLDKNSFEKMLNNTFEDVIYKVRKKCNDDEYTTPTMAMLEVGKTEEYLKNKQKEFADKYSMSENEVLISIEKISHKVFNKYFIF